MRQGFRRADRHDAGRPPKPLAEVLVPRDDATSAIAPQPTARPAFPEMPATAHEAFEEGIRRDISGLPGLPTIVVADE